MASRSAWLRLVVVVAGAILVVGMWGCGGGSGPKTEPEPQRAAPESTPVGSVAYGPTAGSVPDSDTSTTIETDSGHPHESEPVRPDGRPLWWLSQPEYEQGYIRTCAEALGPSLGAARDAALAKGRRELRKLLLLPDQSPDPLTGERVERTWVTALPAKGGPNSYAGYVMISAPVP